MYNHNKAQQSKNRLHISWDILYMSVIGNKVVMKNIGKIQISLIKTKHNKSQKLFMIVLNKLTSFNVFFHFFVTT